MESGAKTTPSAAADSAAVQAAAAPPGAPGLLTMAGTRMLGKFVSVQMLVQAVGVVTGIFLVRVMNHHEYAYFTIANSMQGTMNLLADTGLSIGLSSIGGKIWQDRDRFGQLVNTTMRMRRYLAGAATSVVVPILIWMLITNGASFGYAALISLAVLAGLNYQLVIGVMIAVPRFRSEVDQLQRMDLVAALVRAAAIGVAYLTLLNAATAVLATALMLAIQCFIVKRLAATGIDVTAPVSPEYRKTILGIVKSGVPTTVFYCVQGQVTIWLMTFFGNTRSIAELGALGRLAIIFSVIGSVMTTIVLPRFARYESPAVLKLRFVQIIGGFLLLGLALISFAALLPDVFLWILGNKYALLRHELLLMMILTVVNTVAQAMWSLNSSKAWIRHSWLNIPGTIVMQAILLTVLKLSTLSGVLWFGILSLAPTVLLNVVLAIRGLRSAERQPA